MTKEIICTVCPMGCHILVEGEGEQVTSITGYTCRRGEEYGRQEFSHPVRILTTTVKTDSEAHPPLQPSSSQRTSGTVHGGDQKEESNRPCETV